MAYWELPHQKFRIYPDLLCLEGFWSFSWTETWIPMIWKQRSCVAYNHLKNFIPQKNYAAGSTNSAAFSAETGFFSEWLSPEIVCESVTSYIDRRKPCQQYSVPERYRQRSQCISPAYLSALFKRNRAWVSVTISLLSESTPPAVIFTAKHDSEGNQYEMRLANQYYFSTSFKEKWMSNHSILHTDDNFSDVKILAFSCASYNFLYNKNNVYYHDIFLYECAVNTFYRHYICFAENLSVAVV